jgi:predicted anti-sigma-YlaC factor YlaD
LEGGGRIARILSALALLALLSGCSVRRMALNRVSDLLAEGGSSVQADDDPELIRDAAPFQLKLIESLLEENPDHRGLLRAAAAGFTQYAYAFVQQDAEEVESSDLERSRALSQRARKLYRRAARYGLRALEVAHPGFGEALKKDPATAAGRALKGDVPLLYWTAVSWSAAIALSKDDPEAVADLPQAAALAQRALDLDEAWDSGALHVFFISFEMARPGGGTGAAQRARGHFDRAVALSGGRSASPFVALAEAVAVREQNRPEFENLLQKALAVDVDAEPRWRLQNLIVQRRARGLLARADQLFVE